LFNYKDERDKRLVELTLCGDERAFCELVSRHEKSVLGTAYKIIGDRYGAEDIAQEAFATAWIQLKALAEQDKFGAYVCAIAKNYAKKMIIRDNRLGSIFSLTDYENWEFENFDQAGIWGELSADDIADTLHDEIELLNDTIKQTVKMHYFDGLSVKDIALSLGVPEGTVKWRLSEGRKQLRKGFGVMDKKNQITDDTALVTRVINQLHELELLRIKNNPKGLEKVYHAAMEAVENLHDDKKDYFLASVLYSKSLIDFYAGKRVDDNKEFMARWKQAIMNGHNDMMMCNFTSWENHHLDGQEKIDFMRDVQIPFLKEHNFSLSVGYVYLMMAFEYFWENRYEEALETVKKAKDLLDPVSEYYANAVSAVSAWDYKISVPDSIPTTRGEHIKKINGSLYCCESSGIIFEDTRLRDFGRCDSCILDTSLALGESKVSSCGNVKYTYKDDKTTVETPCGIFENCRVYEVRGDYGERGTQRPFYYTCTSYFCEGVGIVRQDVETDFGGKFDSRSYLLSDYEVFGGEGLFPLCKGNRWAYTDILNVSHTKKYDAHFEVTFCNGTDAMIASDEIVTPIKSEVLE